MNEEIKKPKLKTRTETVINCSDWDDLVKEVYGKPYCFQQQDGCKDRGNFYFSAPEKNPNDYKRSSVSYRNESQMGVSFAAWLAGDGVEKQATIHPIKAPPKANPHKLRFMKENMTKTNELEKVCGQEPNDLALTQPPGETSRDSANNQAAQSPETEKEAAVASSALFGLGDCDPFGVGCNPEDMEDPSFIGGGVCPLKSESDLQGVLGLLRQMLESNQAPVRLHFSVYQSHILKSYD